jgi:ATP-dependent exoDNAse (exonuclease V) beta subunit
LDLKNFDLIDVPENNIIKIKPLLVNSGYNEIANYLAKQLEEHIVTQELYTQVKPGKIITLWKFQEIVSKAFGNNDKNKKTTQKDYTSRMISWLLFAGLIEKQPNRLIIRPVGDGKQKGNPLDCTFAPLTDELEPPLLKLLNSN